MCRFPRPPKRRLEFAKALCYAIQKPTHIDDTLALSHKGLSLQVTRDRSLINGVDQCGLKAEFSQVTAQLSLSLSIILPS